MRIIKWPKKIKDMWRCQYNEQPKPRKESSGFGLTQLKEGGPLVFELKNPYDLFVELCNAHNAMIAAIKEGYAYVIGEDEKPVTLNSNQAGEWYRLCLNEVFYRLCPTCTTNLHLGRKSMNITEALKNE